MAGALEPWGSWQEVQSPDWNGEWTNFFLVAAASFCPWHDRQRVAASVSRSALALPAWGLWQAAHPAALVMGWCAVARFSRICGWHCAQRPVPAARVSLGPLAAWGSWQEMHSPFLKGGRSNLPPAASLAVSCQFAHSFPPAAVTAKGLLELFDAWQESQAPSAMAGWNEA